MKILFEDYLKFKEENKERINSLENSLSLAGTVAEELGPDFIKERLDKKLSEVFIRRWSEEMSEAGEALNKNKEEEAIEDPN